MDGELAEGHTALAYVKFWYDWDWTGAEAEFQRALEISPGYATAHQWYAEYLRLMGRQEEAIVENRKALELDPLSLIINMESGLPFYSERRFNEAIPYFRKTMEMDPNFGLAHCVLGWAYEGKSQYPDAINELETALRLDDSAPVLSSLAHAYASAGRQTDRREESTPPVARAGEETLRVALLPGHGLCGIERKRTSDGFARRRVRPSRLGLAVG